MSRIDPLRDQADVPDDRLARRVIWTRKARPPGPASGGRVLRLDPESSLRSRFAHQLDERIAGGTIWPSCTSTFPTSPAISGVDRLLRSRALILQSLQLELRAFRVLFAWIEVLIGREVEFEFLLGLLELLFRGLGGAARLRKLQLRLRARRDLQQRLPRLTVSPGATRICCTRVS